MTNALTIAHLTRQYSPPDGPTVLRDVSFTAQPADTVAIVGPSGSGKSTLLNIIGSLDKPTSGTVHLGDLEVTALPAKALPHYRATQVGFIFQDHHLLPQLTALENVLLPTLAAGAAKKTARARAAELLEQVGVTHRAAAFPGQLSGGERQRVAIARALINAPPLLLCDEPTGNLDHDNALRIVDLFCALAKNHRVIILMVTHNLELAGRFQTTLPLRDGRLVGVVPAEPRP